MEQDIDTVITCDKCNEYQGTPNQVKGHKITCKGPMPTIEPNQSPDQEPEKATQRPRETSDRAERIPFGVPKKNLPNVPENDGFEYRVMNDNWAKDPGRIQRAMQGGYEKVDGYDAMPVGTNEDGSPIKGVLMRIPKELYDKDQKEKQKEVDKVDDAIYKGILDQQASDKRYVPQGIKIHSNFNENG